MTHKKDDLPGWFPFALVASAVIAIGAGIRSKWKTSASNEAPPSPQTPPVQQAGVLHDWAGVRLG